MEKIQLPIHVQCDMPKHRRVLLIALYGMNKVINLKPVDQLIDLIIKRSIKVTLVKHEQGTTES